MDSGEVFFFFHQNVFLNTYIGLFCDLKPQSTCNDTPIYYYSINNKININEKYLVY